MFVNILILVAATTNILLGVIAIIRHNYKRPLNTSFSLFAFTTGVWALSNFIFILIPSVTALRFSFALGSLVPATASSWLIFFRSSKKKWDRILISVLLVFGVFFFIISIAGDSIVREYKPLITTGYLFPYYALLSSMSIIIPLILSLYIYRESSGIKREQAKYILVGLIFFGMISIFSSLLLPLFGFFQFSRLDSPSSLFFVGASAYAIIRHRLLDIRVVVTRSIIYFFLVLFVTAAFAGIILISTQVFSETFGANTLFISTIGALIVVLVLDPLKRWLSRITDKVFFKAGIDYQQVLQKVSEAINKEYELEPLLNRVSTTLSEGLKIKNSDILMRDDGNFCILGTTPGEKKICLTSQSALVRYLKVKQHASILESLERRIEDTTSEEERTELQHSRADFESLNAAVVAPVMSEGDLKAILTLGPKLSGDSFSAEELRLVGVIGPQVATAIEKAKLFGEVKDFSANLQRKVKQATSELQERNTYLVALQRITSLITEKLDFQKVNQAIVDSVHNELGYIGAMLLYVDKLSGDVKPAAVTETSLTKQAIKMLPKPLFEYATPLNDKPMTLDRQAIINREVKIGTNMAEFFSPPIPKPIILAINKLLRVKTMVAIPLYVEGEVIGVMDVAMAKPREEVSEREMEVLQSIADQMGIVARNLRLFDQLKSTNSQLEEANAHLQQLDQAKTEFVSIASHQLRTPMTGIMGYLSMMTQGDFGKIQPKHQKILVDLLSESQRMIRLINLFLNVSKIEAGKFEIELAPVQIEELIVGEMKEVEKQAAEKGLKLVFTKPQKPLPKAMADPDKVKDVILNLLDNAIKYTAKGSVTASVELDGNEVHVKVKDTGIGIKPQDARELFNKFVRVSGIARIHPDGSGLGLFIAKKIVEAQGGHIWVESEGEQKGATFQFTIPLVKKL